MLPDIFVVNNCNLLRNYFFSLISIVLFIFKIIYNGLEYTKISNIHLVIICGLLIIIIRNPTDYTTTSYIVAFICLSLYFNNNKNNILAIAKCLFILCSIETIICYFQCFDIIQDNIGLNLFSGTFDNPNTYGIFSSLCFPFILCLSRQPRFRYFCYFAMFAIILMLFIQKSKTSLICIILSFTLLTSKFKTITQKRYWGLYLILLCLICICEYKSSLGRLLIILVSCSLFINMPYYGYGINGFSKLYMIRQAHILDINKLNLFIGYEGNPINPLNEYLSYILNIGYIGLVLIIFLLYIIIKTRSLYNIVSFTCIINILVLSLFQNCLHYSFVWIMIAFCITQTKGKKIYLKIKKYNIPITCYCMLCTYFILSNLNFEYKWRRIYDYAYNNPTQSRYLNEYAILYQERNNNPYFLYNYASILHFNGYYEKSNLLLSDYDKYIIDYDGTLLKAENYLKSENYDLALSEFIKSHKMCPSRFKPLWGCLQCYRKTNKKEFKKMATIIANKKVKVDSYNIQLMKEYCKRINQ